MLAASAIYRMKSNGPRTDPNAVWYMTTWRLLVTDPDGLMFVGQV